MDDGFWLGRQRYGVFWIVHERSRLCACRLCTNVDYSVSDYLVV